ncbi:glycosyl hydrolase family 28-related protein [Psychrobacter immobilis]|uniref:glycosyl hydrolase family 28-related protein n=1 Tax=Psychrobacter immobilis TaxID=498 RepID=UPI00191ACA94|nr:glycosyl hydrolase family 28-related protein [Psychrobacter immobilis]
MAYIKPTYAQPSRSQLSVKEFGATGDGNTDDSKAIQAAFDKAAEAKQSLFFPSGTYLLSGIDIKGVSFFGDQACIMSNQDTKQRYLMSDSSTNPIEISNIIFDGSTTVKANKLYQVALRFKKNKQVELNNVDAKNFKNKVAVFEQGTMHNIVRGGVIKDCQSNNIFIFKGYYNQIYGVTFSHCKEHVIRFGRFNSDKDEASGRYNIVDACIFEQVGNDAVLYELNSGKGIIKGCIGHHIRSLVKAETSSEAELPKQKSRDIHVLNNYVDQAIEEKSACIKLNGAQNCMVANNTVIGFYEGISAGSASIIADNIIRDTTHKAIRCNGDHMSIKGNQVINANYGITASRPEVSYLTIMDNHLQYCQKYAISLASSHNLIKDNIITDSKVAINLTKKAEHNKVFNNSGTANDSNIVKGDDSNTFNNNF